MNQLDLALVQRVNAKVSTVVERYLLDDQDVTPERALVPTRSVGLWTNW